VDQHTGLFVEIGGLANFLSQLTCNHNPPDLHLPRKNNFKRLYQPSVNGQAERHVLKRRVQEDTEDLGPSSD
jgi:hypothetical protein